MKPKSHLFLTSLRFHLRPPSFEFRWLSRTKPSLTGSNFDFSGCKTLRTSTPLWTSKSVGYLLFCITTKTGITYCHSTFLHLSKSSINPLCLVVLTHYTLYRYPSSLCYGPCWGLRPDVLTHIPPRQVILPLVTSSWSRPS